MSVIYNKMNDIIQSINQLSSIKKTIAMRKSFTRFWGLLLILLIGLNSYAATTYKPVTGGGTTTTNLKLTQEFSVTFDGAVTASATKYVRLYDDNGTATVSDDTPLFVQPATNSAIIISGSKVTFNFNQYLKEGKSYYIAYDNGAFTVGTTAQPAVNQATWTFAIGDWTAPVLATASSTVKPLVPVDGSTNVDPTVNFVVTFNENVNLGTPVSGNGSGFYLMKDNGTGYGDIVEVIAAANITGAGSKVLTINPAATLAEKSNYYILIEKGAVVDASANSNKFAGFVDEGKLFADKTWGVSTKDMTAPVVKVESVSSTTTSFTVAVTSDDAGFVWVDYVADGGAAPAAIVTSGKKLTFTAAGTQNVTFTSVSGTPTEGATLNRDVWVSSQTNINVSGVTETPATVAAVNAAVVKKADVKLVDGVKPSVAAGGYDPAVASPVTSGVAKDKKLALTFSEAVKIGTGNITIKKSSDNSTWKTYSIADVAAVKDAVASGDKKKIEITLPDNFGSLVQYYVLIDAGAITDLTGNTYAGIASAVPQTWSFTIVDYEAPTYTIAPADGKTVKASVTTGITLTFNENIRQASGIGIAANASVNANGLKEAFELYADGKKISSVYNFNGTNAITVAPDVNVDGSYDAGDVLQEQTTYRLIFYAYWVEDGLGNTIASPSDITFYTSDEIAPSIKAWGPATVEKTSNFTITFTEAVRMADDSEITNSNVANLITLRQWNATPAPGSFTTVGSSNYTVTIDADKKVITVDPVADLVSGGQYRLSLASNIEDLSGIALANTTALAAGFGAATSAADREKDYTVSDYVPPVVTLTPANGASVLPATTIDVTASESVTLLSGAAPDFSMITLREGGVDGAEVNLSLATLTITGNKYSFAPATPLTGGKTYYLAVGASLKDGGNNINTAVSSTFTVKGSTKPELQSGITYSPVAASTLNAKNAAITVTFKEPVVLVAANNTAATVVCNSGADLNTTAATLSSDGLVLTIPHGNFAATASGTPETNNVVVTIPVGMLTAADGTAMTSAIAWTFGSQDEAAPGGTVSTAVYSPLLGGTPAGVAIDVTPTITFSESVKLLSTAYVEIRDVATDYLLQTITGSNLSLKKSAVDDDQLNIKLLGNLTYGKSYYIFIPSNVITDLSGNAFAGVVSKPADGIALAWDFTAVSSPALTVNTTTSVPALYDDNVAVDANLVVEFSNALNSSTIDATKSWVLYQLGGFNTVTRIVTGPLSISDQYSTLDPSMSVSGSEIIVNPTNNLTANKWYILRFENGFIKDTYGTGTLLTGSSAGTGGAAGNMDYVGVNPGDIVFNTGSAQGPVASINPAHKSIDVAKDANITITFDEPFFKSDGTTAITVTDLEATPSTYITVSSSSTGAIAYNATISGNSIVLNPVSDFNVTDNERVTVTVLANKFYDAKGNTYDAIMGNGVTGSPADDQVFYFDPIDQTGPVAAVSGLASAKGTELSYQVTSNEKGYVYSLVQLTSATAPTVAEIKANGTVTEITATGTALPATAIKATGLTPATSYTVYVAGVDAEATPNTGAVASAAVTTPDDVAPVFVKATPASPVTTATPTITFEYNENITAVTVDPVTLAAVHNYAVVREKSTQDIVAAWDIASLAGTSDVGTTSAKMVTLNLGAGNGVVAGSVTSFDSETTYEVRLDPGAVKDAAGNASEDAVTFEFTIKDLVAPTIQSTTPAVSLWVLGGTATTDDGQGMKIKFSENMNSQATVIRIFEDRGATTYAGCIESDNEIETIDPNTVTWNTAHDEATFNISAYLLKAVTKYYIVVNDLCFKDDGGNTVTWASDLYTTGKVWQFQTSDKTTLTATHTFTPAPTVANTNVSPTAIITVNFGEDVVWTAHPFKQYIVPANADSILSIYDANGVELTSAKVTLNAIDTDASSGMDRFTITPVTKFDDNTTYTVKFNDIEDVNGNKVVDPVTAGTQFTFKTGDGTAPKITFAPANTTTEASEIGPFVMTFDEPLYAYTGVSTPGTTPAVQVIDNNVVASYVNLIYVKNCTAALVGTTIPFTATISADYKTITITPKAAIAQTMVDPTVVRYGLKTSVSVADYNGNNITVQTLDATPTVATKNANTFAETTIRDYKAPLVVAAGYSPVGATTATATMRMQFNEDVAIGTGNLYIRELETGNIVETVPASAITVANNDAVLGDYITIPHASFAMNTQFYVTIDEGFVTDISASKNKYAGISDATSTVGKTWTFNTADINGPTVIDQSPEPSSQEVLLEQNLVLTFDQPVQAGTGNIVIYEEDGTPFDIISVPSANVDFNTQYAAGGGDTIVTISHTKFTDASTYFVRIDKGAITDKSTSLNAYEGIADRSWTFKTEDYTAATYTIVSPLDDATDVSLTPTFELSFNRAIQAGTGTIQLWKRAGDVKLQEIAATAATIAADGKSVTFTFPSALPASTDLYLIISANAFVNASVSHVPFGGITEQWTWNFTTIADGEAPTFVTGLPDATTEKVDTTGVVLKAVFSEAIAAGTGSLNVYDSADALVETISAGVVNGDTIAFTMTKDLAEVTTYYVLADSALVKDLAGNASAKITDKTAWTFTTGDFTAPVITPVTPESGTTLTTAHPEALIMTFDENVIAGSGNLYIYNGETAERTFAVADATFDVSTSGVTTVTIPLSGSLDQKTTYHVLIDEGFVTDKSGNAFAGITSATTWTFTTGDFATGTDPIVDGSLDITVYPNPLTDGDNLKVKTSSTLSKVVITSITGQKVKEIINPSDVIISGSELRTGVYFISLYVDNAIVKTERIVKR